MFEHPCSARSWTTNVLDSLVQLPRVERIHFDFCMTGMESRDEGGSAPAKKRTSLATNSEAIAAAVGRLQCDHSHRHIPLTAGRAKHCERYPEAFCRLICEAYARQVDLDRALEGGQGISQFENCDCRDVTGYIAPLVARELEGVDGRIDERVRRWKLFGIRKRAGATH